MSKLRIKELESLETGRSLKVDEMAQTFDYEAGIKITSYSQMVRDDNGEFWRVSGQVALPYATTGSGIPEGDALVSAGDAGLRQDLANPDKGALIVAGVVKFVTQVSELASISEDLIEPGQVVNVGGYGYTYQGENQGFLAPTILDAAIYGVHPDAGDISEALQAAINDVALSGGGTLFIREPGVYTLRVEASEYEGSSTSRRYSGVFLKSGCHIALGDGVIIRRDPASTRLGALFTVNNASNISVSGGKLDGDSQSITYADTSHGIRITGDSYGIEIRDIEIAHCKDGILFGMYQNGGNVRQCTVKRVRSHNNARLGLTIIDFCSDILIEESHFYGQKYNMPMAGIDIEPGLAHPENIAKNITIRKCRFYDNKMQDIVMSRVIGVLIDDCVFNGTPNYSSIVVTSNGGVGAKNVVITNCKAYSGTILFVSTDSDVKVDRLLGDASVYQGASEIAAAINITGDSELTISNSKIIDPVIGLLAHNDPVHSRVLLENVDIIRPRNDAFRTPKLRRLEVRNSSVVFDQSTGYIYRDSSSYDTTRSTVLFDGTTFILEEGSSGSALTIHPGHRVNNCTFRYQGTSSPRAYLFKAPEASDGVISNSVIESTSPDLVVLGYGFSLGHGRVYGCEAFYRANAFNGTNVFNCLDVGSLA